MEDKIRLAKGELLETIGSLIKEKDEDIIHDFGSMGAFLDILDSEIEKLRKLYVENK